MKEKQELHFNLNTVENQKPSEWGYRQLDNYRLTIEADNKAIFTELQRYLTSVDCEKMADKINRMVGYFEKQEDLLSGIEDEMLSINHQSGRDVNESPIYDDDPEDTLVNSALFYQQRINSLRLVSGDSNVDSNYIDAVLGYVRAVERDKLGLSFLGDYDDIKSQQEIIEAAQKNRSEAHNRMIRCLNELNDLCVANKLRPLTYRNLATNSSFNSYRNNRLQYHDRMTAARYAAKMLMLFKVDKNLDSSTIDFI